MGNQMFQYAAGRALALKKRNNFRLDVSDFARYPLHNGFELRRIFNIPEEDATESEVRKILEWQYPKILRTATKRSWMKPFRATGFIVEPHFEYWRGIENTPDDCYLLGYWQSDKYFAEAASEISQAFTFRLPLGERNGQLTERIQASNSVSLHVRRGDYVSDPRTSQVNGACSMDYYEAAVGYVAQRVPEPHFFIFSDDIAWVRENLRVGHLCTYVDNNKGSDSYNDMRLMSFCRHNIVANSSFSWWGAWLNRSGDKIVIAPQRWFANGGNIKDLIPQSWVRL
jgi:hypothetical protein